MRIFHISAECYPFAKVGGLADVVGALPAYQNELSANATVIMPYYATAFVKKTALKSVFKNKVALGDNEYAFEVLSGKKTSFGFAVFLIKIKGLMDREQVYSYPDDVERFTAFQIAALDYIIQLKKKPEVVHCHDHHTGLIPFMMAQCKSYEVLKNVASVLTIHNAQYQGQFGYDKFHYIPQFEQNQAGLLDWNGQINPLAAAIKCAWKVTTVSPSYLAELRQHANGLENLLEYEKGKSIGILNGVDWKVWNPETDEMIPKNYSAKSVQTGKKASKKMLCERFNLDIEKPLFAFIGRMVWEKGADLLPEIFDQFLSSSKNNSNFLVLGSGNKETEAELAKLTEKYAGSYNIYTGYDEPLSHVIYAGADFLLMPSRVEPCGLNQMYSLRYGTIPVVNSIGGLIDTIIDIDEEAGFGIRHKEVQVPLVCEAIARAQELYEDEARFKKIRKKIMQIDHSWHNSVQQYIDLYNSLTT
jgi:starch synthase